MAGSSKYSHVAREPLLVHTAEQQRQCQNVQLLVFLVRVTDRLITALSNNRSSDKNLIPTSQTVADCMRRSGRDALTS